MMRPRKMSVRAKRITVAGFSLQLQPIGLGGGSFERPAGVEIIRVRQRSLEGLDVLGRL